MTEVEDDRLKMGAKPGVNYPLQVIYCGNCTMPIEVRYHIFLFMISCLTFANCSIVNITPSTKNVSSGLNVIYLLNLRK